jgi:hypothetical protein
LFPSGPHDEFLELCAVSTSGQLSQEDQERLREHLASCPSCREALRDFKTLADQALPAFATSERDWSQIDPGPGWSQSKAEERLFRRLAKDENGKPQAPRYAKTAQDSPSAFSRFLPRANESIWRHVFALYAAAMALFVALGFCAYRIGIDRGVDEAKSAPPNSAIPIHPSSPGPSSLEEQLSDASHERQAVRAQIAARDRELVDLRRQLERQSAEMQRMQETQARLASELRTGEAGKQDLAQQRAQLAEKLRTAQAESESLERRLDSLTNDSLESAAQAENLEIKVSDLARQLEERESSLHQQEQLLAHDHDIRELMGARDLYIAEVYDVADSGATRKPYGRVFYTKGKSLIFYAYDLDQQGIKRAQQFQAWGQHGPDRQQALSLGIFYEDNASKKRWVFKLDDPRTLAEIDAVFVTMEPHGGSEKPSGKPLLFAYLRVDPNHP